MQSSSIPNKSGYKNRSLKALADAGLLRAEHEEHIKRDPHGNIKVKALIEIHNKLGILPAAIEKFIWDLPEIGINGSYINKIAEPIIKFYPLNLLTDKILQDALTTGIPQDFFNMVHLLDTNQLLNNERLYQIILKKVHQKVLFLKKLLKLKDRNFNFNLLLDQLETANHTDEILNGMLALKEAKFSDNEIIAIIHEDPATAQFCGLRSQVIAHHQKKKRYSANKEKINYALAFFFQALKLRVESKVSILPYADGLSLFDNFTVPFPNLAPPAYGVMIHLCDKYKDMLYITKNLSITPQNNIVIMHALAYEQIGPGNFEQVINSLLPLFEKNYDTKKLIQFVFFQYLAKALNQPDLAEKSLDLLPAEDYWQAISEILFADKLEFFGLIPPKTAYNAVKLPSITSAIAMMVVRKILSTANLKLVTLLYPYSLKMVNYAANSFYGQQNDFFGLITLQKLTELGVVTPEFIEYCSSQAKHKNVLQQIGYLCRSFGVELNYQLFQDLNSIRDLLFTGDSITNHIQNQLPNHLRTPQNLQTIIHICKTANHPNEVIERITRTIINARGLVQTTHVKSVHKSTAESAMRLHERYGILLADDHIQQTLNDFNKLFKEFRARCFAKHSSLKSQYQILRADSKDDPKMLLELLKLHSTNSHIQLATNDFIEPISNISLKKLYIYFWFALHDTLLCTVKHEDLDNLLIESYYEITRGYNIKDGKDDLGADLTICFSGMFNKLIERLVGYHPDAQLIYLTKESVTDQSNQFIKKAFNDYLTQIAQETPAEFLQLVKNENITEIVWDKIKVNTAAALFEEFKTFFEKQDNPVLSSIIENAIYTDISALKIMQPDYYNAIITPPAASSSNAYMAAATSSVAAASIPTPMELCTSDDEDENMTNSQRVHHKRKRAAEDEGEEARDEDQENSVQAKKSKSASQAASDDEEDSMRDELPASAVAASPAHNPHYFYQPAPTQQYHPAAAAASYSYDHKKG